MISFFQTASISVLLLASTATAFVIPNSVRQSGGLQATSTKLFSVIDDDTADEHANVARREFLISTAATSLLISSFGETALADDLVSGAKGPICVIGANGKTGSECVGACLSRGIDVVATSRGGVYTGTYASKNVKTAVCDVTLPDTIQSAIQGSRAVIFAASASKQGGTPADVDNLGLVNVANACLKNKIPSLVVVSSGGVSRPDSPVFKFLNLFGKIMEEKIKGEDTVRDLYKNADSSTTYTIIRPGGLTEEEAKGISFLELNQGDTKSGRIARADVAALCVEATLFPKLTGGTTFECYDADTAKPLQTVGLSNIMKQTNKASDEVVASGKERRGATFGEIFTGLEKDA